MSFYQSKLSLRLSIKEGRKLYFFLLTIFLTSTRTSVCDGGRRHVKRSYQTAQSRINKLCDKLWFPLLAPRIRTQTLCIMLGTCEKLYMLASGKGNEHVLKILIPLKPFVPAVTLTYNRQDKRFRPRLRIVWQRMEKSDRVFHKNSSIIKSSQRLEAI